MAVPKQRHTKARRNRRRMNIFVKPPALVKCSKCGKFTLPHTICWNCGFYKGVEVINVLEKLEKKERKRREKEMKATAEGEKEKKPLSMEGLSKK